MESEQNEHNNRANRTRISQRLAEMERQIHSSSDTRPPIVTYLRGGAIVSGLTGVGLSLVGLADVFWIVVVCAIVFFIFMIVDPWFERGISTPWKIILSFVMACCMGGFLYWIPFYPARLDRRFVSYEGKYPAGADMYGISWDPVTMSDLRIELANRSGRDYERVSLKVGASGITIRDQQKITKDPFCNIEPVVETTVHGKRTLPQGVEEVEADFTGRANVIITCDRLPSHTSELFILAVSGQTSDREAFARAEKILTSGGGSARDITRRADRETLVAERAKRVIVAGEYFSTLGHRHYIDEDVSVEQN